MNDEPVPPTPPPEAALAASAPDGTARQSLTLAQAHALLEHLASLVESGFPLPEGLEALAAELTDRRVANGLRHIARGVRQGLSLDAAIAAARPAPPSFVRALLAAGLRSGDLPVVLAEYLQSTDEHDRIRSQARLVLAYPAFLALAMLAMWLLFQGIIGPGLLTPIESFELNTRFDTRALRWQQGPGLWLAIGFVGGAPALWLCLWLLRAQSWARRLLNCVPILGTLARFLALSSAWRLLGCLVSRHLPLPLALQCAGEACDDSDLARACEMAAERVQDGDSLSAALRDLPAVPYSVLPIVEWGERCNLLPEALETLGDVFAARASAQVRILRAVAGPILLLGVTATVAQFAGIVATVATLLQAIIG